MYVCMYLFMYIYVVLPPVIFSKCTKSTTASGNALLLLSEVRKLNCMYLNNEIYSTKLQRSEIQKYSRYHMSQHTPHNRVGLHKIQER